MMGNSYGASQFASLFQNCVLWWPGMHCAGVSGDIDEFPIMPSGVTATNNGTFTKTDLGNNKSVVNFDGATNYIQLTNPNNEFTTNLTAFNISTWVKLTNTSALQNLFGISGGSASWNTTNGYVYTLFIFLDNLYFQWYKGTTVYGTGNIAFTSTAWTHISVNVVNSNVYIYVNDDIVLIINECTISLPTNRGYVRIGNDWSINYLNGNLKDLTYSSRPLAVEEIKLLMNRTHPLTGAGMIPGPYDYWRLTA